MIPPITTARFRRRGPSRRHAWRAPSAIRDRPSALPCRARASIRRHACLRRSGVPLRPSVLAFSLADLRMHSSTHHTQRGPAWRGLVRRYLLRGSIGVHVPVGIGTTLLARVVFHFRIPAASLPLRTVSALVTA